MNRRHLRVRRNPRQIILLARAEIATFTDAPDAPDLVQGLLERAGNGLLHTAPYPVKLAHAYYLHRRGATTEAGRILDGILAENRRALTDGADWPVVFMQNAAVYALEGQPATALDELDRAYAAGWRDGRTWRSTLSSPRSGRDRGSFSCGRASPRLLRACVRGPITPGCSRASQAAARRPSICLSQATIRFQNPEAVSLCCRDGTLCRTVWPFGQHLRHFI